MHACVCVRCVRCVHMCMYTYVCVHVYVCMCVSVALLAQVCHSLLTLGVTRGGAGLGIRSFQLKPLASEGPGGPSSGGTDGRKKCK